MMTGITNGECLFKIMGDIMINIEHENSTTNVSNIFIDRYLASANGSYVKVYLYLLRCLSAKDKSFSVSTAADFFDDTEGGITRALKYWEKQGLLSLTVDDKEILGITLLDVVTPEMHALKAAQTQNKASIISIHNPKTKAPDSEKPPVVQRPEYHIYTADEIMKSLDSRELMSITNAIQTYYERTLTSDETSLILFIYNELCFSESLLLHLYETCIEKNQTKIAYIQKVAFDWYENGIKTAEEADIYMQKFNALVSAVNRAFGLNRSLGDVEMKYVNSWQRMGFAPEIVKEACDRTLKGINKPKFEYADKILKEWKAEELMTLSEIHEKDLKRSAENANKSYKKPASALSRSAENYNSRYEQRAYTDDQINDMSCELVMETLNGSN